MRQEIDPVPTPAEMAAALAAMQLSTAAAQASTPSSSCEDTSASSTAANPKVFAAIGTQVESQDIDASADAVAVIADEEGPVAPHLVCHLAMGSLSPEPQGEPAEQNPYQAAAEVRRAIRLQMLSTPAYLLLLL
jgi:hypothetical protein